MTREEINEEQQKKISRENNLELTKKILIIFIKWFLIISVITIIFVAYTTYISNVKISVREYRIVDSKIPESFNGVKIVQFSDLHYGSTMLEEHLKDIKKIINDRKPDIIVFTGDLIAKDYNITSNEFDAISSQLGALNATLGKYAILGDEDDSETVSTIFHQADFTILRNEYDLIYSDDNNPILLVGLSSLLSENQKIDQGYSYFQQESFNPDIYTITLVHEPDTTIDIMDSFSNTNLILAGHSHNGTVRTPFNHLPFERKKGAYSYNQEFYDVDGTKLYISGGLGTSGLFSFRLFCRPSINLYRLSKQ